MHIDDPSVQDIMCISYDMCISKVKVLKQEVRHIQFLVVNCFVFR